jgi:hypothetical protein
MEFNALQRREEELARHRENAGRLAVCQKEWVTTGQGVVEVEDRFDFGLIFVDKPFPSFGCEIDPDDVRDVLALEPDVTPPVLPQVTVYVSEWDRDERGHYVGCWVSIAVLYPAPIPVDAQIAVRHGLQLQGLALKEIPVHEDD